MLNELMDVVRKIIHALFERESPDETRILGVVFFLVVFVVYKWVALKLTGNKARTFFVLVPGFTLMIFAAAAVRVFIGDVISYQILAAAFVLLVAVIPLTRAVQDTSYLRSFFLWCVIFLTAAVVFHTEITVAQAIRDGSKKSSPLRQNNKQLDDVMGIYK